MLSQAYYEHSAFSLRLSLISSCIRIFPQSLLSGLFSYTRKANQIRPKAAAPQVPQLVPQRSTAASLWMVTALGLAIGAGFFIPAFLTLLVSLPVLYNLRLLKPDIIKNDVHTLLTVKCSCIVYPLNHIKDVLNQYKDVTIESINYYEDREYCTATYTFRLISKNDLKWETIINSLLQIESILELSWTEADVP